MTPEEAVERAERAGFRGLVFTEHDQDWRAGELEALRASTGTGLTLLGGRELGMRSAHLMVFGVETSDWPARGSVPEVVAAVRAAGGVCVLAHPWAARFQIPVALARQWGVDGIEVFNSRNADPGREELEACGQSGLALVGGADAHHATDPLDQAWTLVPGWVRTMGDWVRAIRTGATRAGAAGRRVAVAGGGAG